MKQVRIYTRMCLMIYTTLANIPDPAGKLRDVDISYYTMLLLRDVIRLDLYHGLLNNKHMMQAVRHLMMGTLLHSTNIETKYFNCNHRYEQK